MAKFRRTYQSRSRGSKSGNGRIIIALIVLIGIMVLIFRVDFADTALVNWMTEKKVNDTYDRVDIVRVYRKYAVGYSTRESKPVWVAFDAKNAASRPYANYKIEVDTFVQQSSIGPFSGQKPLVLPVDSGQIQSTSYFHTVLIDSLFVHEALLTEYFGQLQYWDRNIGDIRSILGPVDLNDPTKGLYAVALSYRASSPSGFGLMLSGDDHDRNFLQMAVSIDSVERATGLDFFADLMTVEQQRQVESKAHILSWGYDTELFDKRLNQQ